MNNNTFNSIKDFEEYRQNFKLSSDFIFIEYLNEIYSNLLLRVENFNHSNSISIRKSQEIKLKGNVFSSFRNNSLSKKIFKRQKKSIKEYACNHSWIILIFKN
jgi:hypothetical protein